MLLTQPDQAYKYLDDWFNFMNPNQTYSQIATFLIGPRFKITTSMAKARFKPGRCTFMAYFRPFTSMLYLGAIVDRWVTAFELFVYHSGQTLS